MELLDKLNTQFPLKELPVGEFHEFKIKGMTFTVRQYEAAGQAASCAPQEKAQKTGIYVEGLLLHGGPSTDVLKKGLGEEKTADLFRNVLFG